MSAETLNVMAQQSEEKLASHPSAVESVVWELRREEQMPNTRIDGLLDSLNTYGLNADPNYVLAEEALKE